VWDALFQETQGCRKTPFIDVWPDLVKPFLKRAADFYRAAFILSSKVERSPRRLLNALASNVAGA
jgi:hypothetical protein